MNTVDYKAADREQSPCLECPNHLNGTDKRLCLGSCKRLSAYRTGKDWTKEEVYIVAEGKDLIEDMENGEPVDSGFLEADDEAEETDTEEFPGPIKHILPETNWKKTINPKTTKGGRKKCAICGKPEGQDNKFFRGVCRKPCYNQWYSGKVEHPLLGKFKTAPKEASTMTPKKALPDTNMEQLSARADRVDLQVTDICPDTVHLDMSQYPQIMKLVYRMAVELALPVTHIIVTLLAEALANRGKQ